MKLKIKYTIFAMLVLSGLIGLAGYGIYTILSNADNGLEANGIEPKALDLSCDELEAKINYYIERTESSINNPSHGTRNAQLALDYLKIYELKHCPAP